VLITAFPINNVRVLLVSWILGLRQPTGHWPETSFGKAAIRDIHH
jgi:hypothetical protein